MIDFEAVIRYFGPQAVAGLIEEAQVWDGRAIQAMKTKFGPSQLDIDRIAKIRSWLTAYNVFQGIDGQVIPRKLLGVFFGNPVGGVIQLFVITERPLSL